MKPCPECNNEMRDDALFCGSCGARIASDSNNNRTMFGIASVDPAQFKQAKSNTNPSNSFGSNPQKDLGDRSDVITQSNSGPLQNSSIVSGAQSFHSPMDESSSSERRDSRPIDALDLNSFEIDTSGHQQSASQTTRNSDPVLNTTFTHPQKKPKSSADSKKYYVLGAIAAALLILFVLFMGIGTYIYFAATEF